MLKDSTVLKEIKQCAVGFFLDFNGMNDQIAGKFMPLWTWRKVTPRCLSNCGTHSYHALMSSTSQQRKPKIIVSHKESLTGFVYIIEVWDFRTVKEMFVERKTPELCSNLQNAAHRSGYVLLFQQRKGRGDVPWEQIQRECYQNETSGCNAGQGW